VAQSPPGSEPHTPVFLPNYDETHSKRRFPTEIARLVDALNDVNSRQDHAVETPRTDSVNSQTTPNTTRPTAAFFLKKNIELIVAAFRCALKLLAKTTTSHW